MCIYFIHCMGFLKVYARLITFICAHLCVSLDGCNGNEYPSTLLLVAEPKKEFSFNCLDNNHSREEVICQLCHHPTTVALTSLLTASEALRSASLCACVWCVYYGL